MMSLLTNLLLGEMPESLGLLLFGVTLIAVTVGARWILNGNEEEYPEK